MTLGEYVRLYRKEHAMSQRQLATACQLSNGYIWMIENNMNPKTKEPIIPTLETLKKLADGMSISLQKLLESVDDMPVSLAFAQDAFPSQPPNIPDNIIETKSLQRKTVPLLGPIAAGKPVYMDDTEQVYIPMDDPAAADFALRVEGDSMEPLYEDGDMVYLRQVDDVDDGQIAAVIIDDSATLKRVYHGMSSVTLASENPAYPPMLFTARDHDRISIIGEPVGFLRMRKK